MSDLIHFGSFSKATNGFKSTNSKDDFELFKTENPDFSRQGYDFSFPLRLQLSFFTKQKYGLDATREIVLDGEDLRIVSLKAIEKEWNNILSFVAVSSIKGGLMAPDEEELGELKKELTEILNAAKEAQQKWGDKTCLLIW